MAVTNLEFQEHPGKVIKSVRIMGNGTPVGDPIEADDATYPIGSTYTDLDDGKIYTKNAAGAFIDSSAA